MESMQKFTLKYHKTKALDPEPQLLESIVSAQQYNPIYSDFFELSESNYNHICLNHRFLVKSLDEVVDLETKEVVQKPVFVKYSPLLDPIRYMIGKYEPDFDRLRTLPTIDRAEEAAVFPKMKLSNNASYVDAFFSFLTSKMLNHHGFVNGIDYYGSFLGIQPKFRMNIADDLEYLNNSDFFIQHLGKRVTIEDYEGKPEFANYGSRGNKEKIVFLEESGDIDAIDLAEIDLLNDITDLDNDVSVEGLEMVYEKTKKGTQKGSRNTASSASSSEDSKINYSTDSDKGEDTGGESEGEGDDESWETASDDDESDESDESEGSDKTGDSHTENSSQSDDDDDDEITAYIHDFPVQMICLEKCEGTLDELFVKDEIDEHIAASALFQVVMSLILYQKAFHFTHNDLHTNNIMFVSTDQEFLDYCYNNVYYRVPTYGRIFKLIDFGRGIYRFAGKQFCSDSFAPGGDAATQYNFEPYINKHKPRLEPNYAFDLCRLGCSIYDFIIDEGMPESEMDEFQKTVKRWCTDDNKRNVLYKSSGEERYPNFKLYKMIARTCNAHTPQEQLKYRFFKQFVFKGILDNCINIDDIPCYAK